MGRRMTWEEMKRVYPDEWLAIVNYTSNDIGDVDGEVAYHSNDKDDFYRHAKGVVDRYGGMAMRYTGELIKNPEVPLLMMRSPSKLGVVVASVAAMMISLGDASLVSHGSARAMDRRVAITIDDLPVINPERHAPEEQIEIIRVVTQVLARHRVPATGFMIGRNIRPFHHEALTEFIRSGNAIGNHSFSHLSPNKVPIGEYLADIGKGQEAIREWAGGVKFYRFPFLQEGRTERDHARIRQYLSDHGYATAEVTIDNDDWSFNRDYVTALKGSDVEDARRIGRDYLDHMKGQARHFEIRAKEVAGRPISQILLLHMSRINADYLDRLLSWYEAEGYEFIPLAEALSDPVYSWNDRFRGENGISWLDRIIEPPGIPTTGL